ncbi:hypothetical protein [Hymenobacter sp. HSC-4F20]|uniref:hypothetical protein n=1 Tax=Hymenobacter sp. HSC-4F20 TaxID=2864135 RepID=UPI001C729DE7|nr:hypothetical protein [Hymenobacter sp. HSC-4F20]
MFIILLLVTVGCTRNPAIEPVCSTVASLSLDNVTPDTLHVLKGPKTINLEGKKIKLKRGATLVIQQGQTNTATTIGKAKNSTLAVGEGATATDNTKAGHKANGGVAVGDNNAATGSQEVRETGWPWYVWSALGIGMLYGLVQLKKWLGL